ncbi:general transcription factor IIF subunit 2-like [Mizuhopecten yessoensis]|uniref:general transcription factor IIF subunit 2-like n=1 Tax=Mizuhopecten yessoensis TaxID=6573 RepID=UPI000B45C1E3|nr:general transcription factor IIF subunit 2-like [Mizuhopecten yessoensis]
MQEAGFERAHVPRDVDVAAAARGVWLVKVPKYLSEKWKKNSGNSDVGKLKITTSKFPDQKPNVVFTLNDSLANQKVPGEQPCPKEHKMKLTGLGNQNLVIFSQIPLSGKKEGEAGTSESMPLEKIALEGRVIQRAECTPLIKDNKYLDLKRLQTEVTNRPKREVIQIDTVVASYKPVSNHKFNVMHDEKVKNEGKRLRADKDKVMDMLFNAFEKHQYYNVKDLVTLTKQPITYLKEILKEICTYNMRAPHRNMWELKPEYRHYKEQGPSDG